MKFVTKVTKHQEQGIRLERLLEQLNLNQSELARLIKVSPSLINQIINGQKALSHKVLSQLTNSYNQVNANWLLTGQGEMFLKKQIIQIATSDPQVNEDKIHYIPLSNGIFESLVARVRALEDRVVELEAELRALREGCGGKE